MSRLTPLAPQDMTPAQKNYYDALMQRPNNKNQPAGVPLTGPFHAWQRSPEFAVKLGVWEQYLRKDGLLEPRLLEFATITVGRIWSAKIILARTARRQWRRESILKLWSRYDAGKPRSSKNPTKPPSIISPIN